MRVAARLNMCLALATPEVFDGAMPGRTTTILLLDAPPVSEYLRQAVRGMNRFCREHPGFLIRTASSETNILEDSETIDGVFGLVDHWEPNHPSTRFGKPVVNIANITAPVPFPSVGADSRKIGRLAAEHLIRQGYRSFAYHMESRVFFSRERHAGFAETLAAQGYECAVFDTGFYPQETAAGQHAKTVAWLRELPKPLGLFTHNDQRASALMNVCDDAKLNIPDEIGIIGVDSDPLLAELAMPSLTSVDTGAIAIGYYAAQTLARMIDGESIPITPVYLPPQGVVARGSTDSKHLMDSRLKTALEFIHNSPVARLSVDRVLEFTPTSRRSLERLFKAHVGHLPAEEIRRVRMNHAKWQLISSNHSLPEIAIECGYSIFSNFAKVFRKETGSNPLEYRNRFRRDGQWQHLR